MKRLPSTSVGSNKHLCIDFCSCCGHEALLANSNFSRRRLYLASVFVLRDCEVMITHHGIQESCAALHFIEIKAHGDCRSGNDTEVPLGVISPNRALGARHV